MKFLFRSAAGDSMSIARRVASEGHDVLLWIARREMRHVGDGFVDKTTNIKAVEWADVIVFDSHSEGLALEAEKWRQSKPVFGSSKLADELEHDRHLGIDIMEAQDITIPDYRMFSGTEAFAKARDYIQSSENSYGWVLKPNVDAIRTRIARD